MIEYLPNSSSQLIGLLYSAGVGLSLGFLYEILRLIFFIASGSDKKFTLARDIIFLLFCLVTTFFFFLVQYNGKVMFYAVAGELTGGYAAFRLVNPPVNFLIKKKLPKVRKKIIAFWNRLRLFRQKISNHKKKTYKIRKKFIK